VTSSPFVSYAQNREDVVLRRALCDVDHGRYVDVGANDPTEDSVSRAFYDAGWRGITIEPVHEFAERLRTERPGDVVVEAAINEQEGGVIELLEIGDARLSTLIEEIGEQHERDGWELRRVEVPSRRLDAVLREVDWSGEIHFLSIDTEGAEEAVLRSIDLREFRPWIIVVEATKPRSSEPSHQPWEPLLTAAGYRFTLFDGLSRFYLAPEKWDDLHERLQAPASVLDDYVTFRWEEREAELQRLMQAGADLNSALSGTTLELDTVLAERAAAAAERDAATAERDAATAESSSVRAERDAATAERDAANNDRDAVRAELDAVRAELDVVIRDREQIVSEAAAQNRSNAAALVRWRGAALGAWSKAVSSTSVVPVSNSEELTFLRNHTHAVTQELAAMKGTLSWRVTRPLRAVRRLGKLVRR